MTARSRRMVILGAGSWGTALSVVLARAKGPHDIALWARGQTLAEALHKNRENPDYLPGIKVPLEVEIHGDMARAAAQAEIVICAVPSAHVRSVLSAALPNLPSKCIIVSASKGLEPATHLRVSEVISRVCRKKIASRFAVLSGPSFALEAARGEPTAVVLASTNARLAANLQERFSSASFRLYTNDDVLGVELAGAMKNVMAIAAGACQGIGLGSNALAALITRGLAEMTRLARAAGARAETMSGLAGLGDLVLTCTGALSRNRQVGVALGQGRKIDEILEGMKMIAEGVGTAAALLALARQFKVEMPITQQVDAILNHGKAPQEAIRAVMERPLKRE